MDIKKIRVDIENFFDNSNMDGVYEIFMEANEKFYKKIQNRNGLSEKAQSVQDYVFGKDKPFGCNTNAVANLCSLLLDEDIKIGVKFDIPLVIFKAIDFEGLKDNFYFIITEVYPDENKIEIFGLSSGDVYYKSSQSVGIDDFEICKYDDVVKVVDGFKKKRGAKELKKLVVGL